MGRHHVQIETVFACLIRGPSFGWVASQLAEQSLANPEPCVRLRTGRTEFLRFANARPSGQRLRRSPSEISDWRSRIRDATEKNQIGILRRLSPLDDAAFDCNNEIA